jgi:sulfite dehydrogenase (cytochrome) subunit B
VRRQAPVTALFALLAVSCSGCKKPPPEPSPAVILPTDEPPLPAGPGREAFYANCQKCHSTRYVTDQAPLPRKTWTAEVEKMRATYGGPIPAESQGAIVDYLVTVNGKE